MALAVLFGARITRALLTLFFSSCCTGRARKLLHTPHMARKNTANATPSHVNRFKIGLFLDGTRARAFCSARISAPAHARSFSSLSVKLFMSLYYI
jgi:hypothetical protein